MLDDTTTCWWYEQDGRQAGPVTAAAIARLVVEGRLGPGHRVWRDGMATWEPLSSVAELAPALAAGRPPPSPPPLSAPPPAWGGQPPSWGAPAPAGARPATPLPGPARGAREVRDECARGDLARRRRDPLDSSPSASTAS